MTQPAISVRNLSKSYRLGTIGRHTLAEECQYLWHRFRGRDPRQHMARIGPGVRAAEADAEGDGLFWALKDVSFDVEPGEVIGIIGRNGAGKSTLLKLLTRITEPTSGEAVIHGRVASLLEVGTGFHPELTGRENIYMNGTILGMKKSEIDAKFDEIVAFSEIEKFIDTPVKRYSSGMYVRLAFSVAAHLEPEILLVDEVLAVGDAAFQKKCLGKMGDVSRAGRTVLFVSHNMAAVQNLCPRTVWLEDGRTRRIGATEQIFRAYLSAGHAGSSAAYRRKDAPPGSGGYIESVRFLDAAGKPVYSTGMGDGGTIEAVVAGVEEAGRYLLGFALFNDQGERLCTLHSQTTANLSFAVAAGERVRVACTVPAINLLPGTFKVSAVLQVAGHKLKVVDKVDPAFEFEVVGKDVFQTGRMSNLSGVFYWPCRWDVAPVPTAEAC